MPAKIWKTFQKEGLLVQESWAICNTAFLESFKISGLGRGGAAARSSCSDFLQSPQWLGEALFENVF